MMTHRSKFYLILVAVWFILPKASGAQFDTTPCQDVRFIFLVSRSNSIERSDPTNERFKAVQQIIAYLTTLYLDFFDRIPGLVCYDPHIAVITFNNSSDSNGTSATPIIFETAGLSSPWIDLRRYSGIENPDDRQSQLSQDFTRIQQMEFPGGCRAGIPPARNDRCNESGTDYVEAYQSALDLLSPRQGISKDPTRQIAMIFISDGHLCLGGLCNDVGSVPESIYDLRDQLEDMLPQTERDRLGHLFTYLVGLDRLLNRNPAEPDPSSIYAYTDFFWQENQVFDRVIPTPDEINRIDEIDIELFPTLIGIANDVFQRTELPTHVTVHDINERSLVRLNPQNVFEPTLYAVSALTLDMRVAAGFAPNASFPQAITIAPPQTLTGEVANSLVMTRRIPAVGQSMNAYSEVWEIDPARGEWHMSISHPDPNFLHNSLVYMYQRDAEWQLSSPTNFYQHARIPLTVEFVPTRIFGQDVGICLQAQPTSGYAAESVRLNLKDNHFEGEFYPIYSGDYILTYRICQENGEIFDPAFFEVEQKVEPISFAWGGDCSTPLSKFPGQEINLEVALQTPNGFDSTTPLPDFTAIQWDTTLNGDPLAIPDRLALESHIPQTSNSLMFRYERNYAGNVREELEISFAPKTRAGSLIDLLSCQIPVEPLDVQVFQNNQDMTLTLTITNPDQVTRLTNQELSLHWVVQNEIVPRENSVVFECNTTCFAVANLNPFRNLAFGHYNVTYWVNLNSRLNYPIDYDPDDEFPIQWDRRQFPYLGR